jgi:hypothetical protein
VDKVSLKVYGVTAAFFWKSLFGCFNQNF